MFPKFNQRQIHYFEAPRTIENQVWQTQHSIRPVSSFENNHLHKKVRILFGISTHAKT